MTTFIDYNGRLMPMDEVLRLKQPVKDAGVKNDGNKDTNLEDDVVSDIEELRKEYKKIFGRNPSSNIKIETLKEKINKAKDELQNG